MVSSLSGKEQRISCNIQFTRKSQSHLKTANVYNVLSKVLIYLVPSCLLPSPYFFFFSGIPLTHHSSSHLPPLAPVSAYLPSSVLTLLSFQHISHCVFFPSMSVLILLHMLLFPRAVPRPGLCSCNVTDKLFRHTFAFLSHPPCCHFLYFVVTNANLGRHKDCRKPTKSGLFSLH